MKRSWFFYLIVLVLLVGCSTKKFTPDEQAADVPRLTRAMHAAFIRMNYPCETNLPPHEVEQMYAMVIDEHPVLDLFKSDLKLIRCNDGEIVLLLLDPDTGNALFEDASCTPFLDRRWIESDSPPQSFTISHPETCGCEEK